MFDEHLLISLKSRVSWVVRGWFRSLRCRCPGPAILRRSDERIMNTVLCGACV